MRSLKLELARKSIHFIGVGYIPLYLYAGRDTTLFVVPPWPGVTVKTAVVKHILENEGYTVETKQLDAGIVYQQIADKEGIDAMLAGWFPVTHGEYWDRYSYGLEQVAVNEPTTWLGLAVPTYVYEAGIHSVEDLKGNSSKFDGKIVGIEPGAGIMNSTEQAISTYGLEEYDISQGSTPTMITSLDRAIQKEEWVVVTLWEPHSAFAVFDIKKLDDPEDIYGGGDKVYTVARNDFQEDYPKVYAFFKKFQIEADTQSEWIHQYSDLDKDPETIAEEWTAANQDKVQEWTSVFE